MALSARPRTSRLSFLKLSCAREMRRAQCSISCLNMRSRDVKMRSHVDVGDCDAACAARARRRIRFRSRNAETILTLVCEPT
jgi:hypothetical protein